MSHTEAEKDFKEAIKLYHNHFVAEALAMMKKALEEEPGNPIYLSHLGVLMSQAKKNYPMALKLCNQAIKKKHNNPELHLNLANVYVDAGRYDDAVHALEIGLKYTKQDKSLKQRLKQLGDRRPPMIPFLGRQNFLNVQLGKIRHSIIAALDHD